jgi:UDPglucose 6-dehydrogenase
MKIGIIGQGFVGGAIREKFKQHYEVIAYDKLWGHAKGFGPSENIHDFDEGTNGKEVVENSDVIFVCLPTPMYMETGECDISIVRDAIVELDGYAKELGVTRTVIIKSTIPPGTTKAIDSLCDNIDVCFSPEFLTEANAVKDFENQDRIVIGSEIPAVATAIKMVFKEVFPDANYYMLSTAEAEMVKYTANLFLATKVSFFNDMYSVCDKLGIEFQKVADVAVTDKRIGKSHYTVPGPDGDRGFGGHCFPKDTAAIKFIADSLGINIPTIDGMWQTNENVRKNKDWEKMDGRAVTRNKSKQEK